MNIAERHVRRVSLNFSNGSNEKEILVFYIMDIITGYCVIPQRCPQKERNNDNNDDDDGDYKSSSSTTALYYWYWYCTVKRNFKSKTKLRKDWKCKRLQNCLYHSLYHFHYLRNNRHHCY